MDTIKEIVFGPPPELPKISETDPTSLVYYIAPTRVEWKVDIEKFPVDMQVQLVFIRAMQNAALLQYPLYLDKALHRQNSKEWAEKGYDQGISGARKAGKITQLGGFLSMACTMGGSAIVSKLAGFQPSFGVFLNNSYVPNLQDGKQLNDAVQAEALHVLKRSSHYSMDQYR